MSKSLKTSINDRFTRLPEHVAHEILKFLPLEDTCRLSVVSRRCRQFCISMPSLNVDVKPYLHTATKRTRLMNYVERLLLLRRGMATHRFYINWCLESSLNDDGGEEEEYRVLSWLHNAVLCEVKELELILRPKSGSAFSLPPSLIRSMSLESLTVSNRSMNGILTFPSHSSSIGFSSLKSLTLSRVRIQEYFGHWVSTCCNCLEKLFLYWVKGIENLVINSSSLKELRISSMDLCHLIVCAENIAAFGSKLRLFCVRGKLLHFPLRENLAGLKSDGRILCPSSASPLSSQRLIHLYVDVSLLIKFLNCRDPKLLQTWTDGGRVPILFPSLLALHILTPSIRTDLIPVLASLFEGSSTPYRHLYIWSKILPSHTRATESEARESTKNCDMQTGTTVMQNLNFVTIELIHQEKNELEVIKYLFENAKYLKRMNILCAPPLGSDVIGEIRGHKKASANVVVKFHPI
ncbi:LRR-domain containing protein [Parasponia andersonii]|uniref:LRR-domain containing protein n=1 Tax=Parasponia andersonii TaxID=3476 RepID=A0A2P5BTW7_PARAD|nr:LRR-domain containing protein [Parasponia andersonii]